MPRFKLALAHPSPDLSQGPFFSAGRKDDGPEACFSPQRRADRRQDHVSRHVLLGGLRDQKPVRGRRAGEHGVSSACAATGLPVGGADGESVRMRGALAQE